MKIWFESKDTKNPTSIRIVVSVGGITFKKETGQKINPASRFWNNGYPRDIIQNQGIILALKNLKNELEAFEQKIYLERKALTAHMVKEHLLKAINQRTSPTDTFHDIMEKFIEARSEELAVGTMKAYRSMANHIKAYEAKHHTVLTLEDINEPLGAKFRKYLLEEGLQNPTVKKVITHLKGFGQWAFENKLTSNTDFLLIKKYKVKDQAIVVLSPKELKQLEDYEPKTESLKRVKDLFLFTCYTGLRYGDLSKATKENIISKKGTKILHIVLTNKNNKAIDLPLAPKAIKILEKYDYELNPISNQKLNEYIKALIKAAEIDSYVDMVDQRGRNFKIIKARKYDVISIHDGRKTFITTCLLEGVGTELAMRLATHSEYNSFKRYVHFTEDTLINAIEKAIK